MNIYGRWPTSTWKHARHHSLLEKCKSKLQWDYHLPLVRVAIIKKSINNECWRGCGEKGMQTETATMEKNMEIPQKKTRNKIAVWPSNPTAGHIPWENRDRNTHAHVFTAALFTAVRTWGNRVPTDRWMGKEDGVPIFNAILLSHKKKKKNESKSILVRWLNLEPVTQSD